MVPPGGHFHKCEEAGLHQQNSEPLSAAYETKLNQAAAAMHQPVILDAKLQMLVFKWKSPAATGN